MFTNFKQLTAQWLNVSLIKKPSPANSGHVGLSAGLLTQIGATQNTLRTLFKRPRTRLAGAAAGQS